MQPRAALPTETFPTNGPITSGQVLTWTNYGTLSVVGNHAQAAPPATGYYDNLARAAPLLATQNQFVQASVTFIAPLTGSAAAGVVARYAASTNTGIALYVYASGSTYKMGAYGLVNGVNADHYGTDVDVTLAATNILRFEITGTGPNVLMVGYLNGTIVWTASGQTTTSYAGNQGTGFAIQLGSTTAANSVQVDDWSAGDLATSSGTTVTASTCGMAQVQAAFDLVTATTTRIQIPAGTCHWLKHGVAVTLPALSADLEILGAGTITGDTIGCGGCATKIIDDDPDGSFPNGTLVIDSSQLGTHTLRFAGFYFERGLAPARDDGFVKFLAYNQAVRIDHNTLIINNLAMYTMVAFGVTGVYDHNLVEGGGIELIQDGGSKGLYSPFGDGNWARPTNFGSDEFLFIETNTFFHNPVVSFGGSSGDCRGGSKIVVRHNTIQGAIVTHGLDQDVGRSRGCRAMEIYQNQFTEAVQGSGQAFNAHFQTTGTSLIWGNTANPAYQFFTTTHAGRTWGANGANSPYPGPGYPPFPLSWGNCGTQIFGPGTYLGVGSTIDQNADVPSGYRCADQPGMGQGDLLANDFPTITNTATGCTASQACIWPRQKLEPIYEWANTWPGSSTTPNKIFPYEPTTVENRDFYQEKASFNGTIGVGQGPKSRIVSPGDLFNSCTAGPGGNTNGVAYWATDEQKLYVCNPTNTWTLYYTSYPYPHPLIGTVAPPPPAAPTNLRIVP
jgi:hypothetical protein